MDNIESHIQKNKNILNDPTISPQHRRHIEGELQDLESYHRKHPEDDHDPTSLELYCDTHPNASECKIYND